MNKTVVLVFLCSFLMSSNLHSMNENNDELEIESYGDFSIRPELMFKLSSEEDEIDTDSGEFSYSEDALPDSPKLAAWISNDPLQCPLASFSMTSDETETMTCPYCDANLLNTSFDFNEHDNEYICSDCIANRPWLIWAALEAEDHALRSTSPESSEIEIKASSSRQDDEPLFDHKKGNARSHAISRHYRAKRSSIRVLEKEIISWPMHKQKLRSLRAQKDLVLAGKPKLPNL